MAGLRITQNIQPGVRALDRRPGLRDASLPGEVGSERFAPSYEIIINGNTITDDVKARVVSIEYEDNEELFDQIKITLQGYFEDPIKSRTVPVPEWVQSDPTFSEGNIIWIMMGYGTYSRLIGGGEIVKREFSYNENPQVVITAYEPLHRMANQWAEDAITYKGMRSSEIVKKIAQKPAYSGRIGALFDTSSIDLLPIFTPKAEVQKRDESDYAFLKRMADVRGWHLFTRFDLKTKKFKLFYGPDVDRQEQIFRYDYQPPTELSPEDTLIEFVPEINTIDQKTDVEVTAIDEKKKKTVKQEKGSVRYRTLADGKNKNFRTLTGKNTSFKQEELKNGFAYRFNIFGVSKKIIATRPFKDEGEVKKFVINWARENIKNFITGSGRVAGNEFLQSRQSILFFGLGDTFSGSEAHPAKWYVRKVTHTMSAGVGGLTYESKFDVRKVIDWLPDGDLRANPPAAEKTKSAKQNANRYKILGDTKTEGEQGGI